MSEEIRVNVFPENVSASLKLSQVRLAIAEASPMYTGNGEWYLNRVMVPNGFRRKGVGSRLLKALMEKLPEVGCKKLIVEPGGYTLSTRKQKKFYRENGFVQCREWMERVVGS